MSAGYHDFKLSLQWFAKDGGEWRVITDCGQYVSTKDIDQLPSAVKQLLKSSALITMKTFEGVS